MERTYINEFHKQWIESTLKSITSWQKRKRLGDAVPPPQKK